MASPPKDEENKVQKEVDIEDIIQSNSTNTYKEVEPLIQEENPEKSEENEKISNDKIEENQNKIEGELEIIEKTNQIKTEEKVRDPKEENTNLIENEKKVENNVKSD